ncbi:putative RNA polymerase II nuclear localization protein SLC7A6OS [Glandiceps talaboti]
MAAVIRVKRKRTIDPADTLILSCKKSKQADSEQLPDSSEIDSVFRFAGTIAGKDEPIDQIQSAIDSAKQKLKRSGPSKILEQINLKSRELRKTVSQSSRYKVVSKHRNVNTESNDDEKPSKGECEKKQTRDTSGSNKLKSICDDKENSSQNLKEVRGDGACAAEDTTEIEASRLYCLYDIVQEEQEAQHEVRKKSPGSRTKSPNPDVLMCNNIQMIREKLTIEDETKPKPKETEYVYDLYYADPATLDIKALESITAIMGYSNEDFLFANNDDDDVRGNEYDDEDDDSNDESNWRNDYPDEDPNYFEEDGHRCHGDDDLSSDEEESDDEYCNHNSEYRYRNMDYEYEVQDYNDRDYDDDDDEDEDDDRHDGFIV